MLSNCQHNVERHLRRHPLQPLPQSPRHRDSDGVCSTVPGNGGTRVAVRHLNWLDPPDWLLPPGAEGAEALPAGQQQHVQGDNPHVCAGAASPGTAAASMAASGGSFAWRADDLRDLQHLDLLLAADPVYEDTLTEGLMRWWELAGRVPGLLPWTAFLASPPPCHAA